MVVIWEKFSSVENFIPPGVITMTNFSWTLSLIPIPVIGKKGAPFSPTMQMHVETADALTPEMQRFLLMDNARQGQVVWS